ncbi:MAG: magnesium transporter [Candidatus Cloacimonadota bacterium]
MSHPYSGQKVQSLMRKDFLALHQDYSISEALDFIRQNSGSDRIVYYYTIDDEGVLAGVVSTRQLITTDLSTPLNQIHNTRVRSIPCRAEIADVLTDFVVHKYLALPVVDADRRLVGVVDVSVFSDNIDDILERDAADSVFETIGFRLSQIKGASPIKAFRYRFPWLLATIASGIACALMTSRFEHILAASIVLSFFLTLVLGLGESVSMQSMTLTIQALRSTKPSAKWFFQELGREAISSLLLGLASAVTVGVIVYIWRGEPGTSLAIGGSLILSLVTACLTGLSIPAVLHTLRLDPKIAAGPLTLALADIFTIVIYFNAAALVL